MAKVKAPKGQNVGNSDRGTVWAPSFRMGKRQVNRHKSSGSQQNQPATNIDARKGGKPGFLGRHA